jgi:ubiquinone/menaquinone biosynthesis C-methylase UbiE
MRRSILLTAMAVILSAQSSAAVPQDPGRLAEPNEQAANAIQPPAQVMDLIGIRPGLVIGEVGAGRGRVTVHLAARVGEKGKIYANDINPAAVEYLKERCRRQGLSNVETILGLVDDARFPKNSLDLVFMAWVFHHVDKPVPLLKSLLPSLKPWGVVVMVEPAPAHTERSSRALTRELVGEEAKDAGFQLDGIIEGRLKEDNIFILRPIVPDTPDSTDRQKVRALWEAYLAWAKAAKGGASPRDYAVSLDKEGVPVAEIRRRLQVLRGQFTEQPEGIEMIYDPLYGQPLTGELEKDGFKTAPNVFLVEAMKEIKTGGKALDVGAGMGRNAIHLAKLGWDVTGIDLSAQGLAVMRSSAEKAGLKVQTVKTSYEDYDFGKERWDLVAMILSWAPVEDSAFLSRLKDSVRPGGYVVFEHVVQRPGNPFPPGVHAPAPGALREFFRDFEILTYREVDDYGDWGGPPTPHVRMVARKGLSRNPSAGPTLSDNLKILGPLAGKHWDGDMKLVDGSGTVKADRNFDVLWDGGVVKYTASVPEIGSFSEGYFYWDQAAGKVAVFLISSRGVIQRGTVSVEQGLLTVQGTIAFPERTFEYKNTFEFTAEGKMIDRWFQNAFGPWRPGHVIEFAEIKPD